MDTTSLKSNKVLKKLGSLGVLWALVIVFIIGCIASDKFATSGNIINVMRQISINGIIALAMTFVCLTGGVDLSVGSQVAVYSMMIAQMLKAGMNPWIAIPLTCLASLVIGFLNGLGITKGHLAPFIMTLGSMTALRGLAKYISNGAPQNWRATGTDITFIGQGYVGFIPFSVILFAIMFLIGFYVLRSTRFGRNVYAIGDNREAARLNGINTQLTELICFVLTAFASFMAALVLTSKLTSADPSAGDGYVLKALSMCYIGGISTAGGVGTIVGTLIGICLLSVLSNIMNLVGINSYMQDIVQGLIVIFAVLISAVGDRKKS